MASGKHFDNREAINTFFIEGRDILENMESDLITLEKGEMDDEILNSIFRCAHTIKGTAGMFGFEEIESFTHIMESLLDDVRKKEILINSEMISLLLQCKDFMGAMLDFFQNNESTLMSDEMSGTGIMLRERLMQYFEKGNEYGDTGKVTNQSWHISLRFHENVFKVGLDPQSFISYLNKIGKIVNIVSVKDSLPSFSEYIPADCYLGFEIKFLADTTKEKIQDVFEYVQDDCSIRIIPPQSTIDDFVKLIQELPEENFKIGDMLTKIGTLTETELNQALKLQKSSVAEDLEKSDIKPLGQIIMESNMVPRQIIEAALQKQESIRKNSEKVHTIRVDANKLDILINLIGELVITSSNVSQLSEKTRSNELIESVSEMTRLIENIRDSTMNVRMVQIGETFRKYERIIRDLSKETGKEINLEMHGGETELDKTLVEKIADPLTHLIRNAIDHGIGKPDERAAMGKSRAGNLKLNAFHETGGIVIEVIDDGNGLDREKILNKAVEKGLVSAAHQLSETEIFQFIFEPGFSTAEKITNISGRGVGMDVVRNNIELLRGTVILKSEKGAGTTVRIHLPLTLAIIDGFLIQLGSDFYVIPLDMVVECIEVEKADIKGKEAGNFINMRGEVLPFMRLREFFNLTYEPVRENIVVVEYAQKKAGLIVDKPHGEFQTVVKPFGRLFKSLKWVSGSTILGNGQVALILDIPKLIHELQGMEIFLNS